MKVLSLKIFFIVFISVYAFKTNAQDSIYVNWLKNNAVKINSIDPNDEDFSDLQSLKTAIGNSRIVMLGEQTHGDGATFEAKTRLIKFLHREMGFNVLAFESPMYDCEKTNEQLNQDVNPFKAIWYSVFTVWASSEQFQPLIKYIGDEIKTEHPITVTGFDCQYGEVNSHNYFVNDLKFLLDSILKSPVTKTQEWDSFIYALKFNDPFSKEFKRNKNLNKKQIQAFITVIDKIQDELNTYTNLSPANEKEIRFWKQEIKSLKSSQIAFTGSEMTKEYLDMRDRQMADNLIWLSLNYYPNEKIIVWAATAHIAKNEETNGVSKPVTGNWISMGNRVYEKLKNQVYIIGFTASEGSWGRNFDVKSIKLTNPPKNSFEFLFSKAGYENAFLDLRENKNNNSGKWLTKKREMSPDGYVYQDADWTQVFDGVIYIRTMKRSDMINVDYFKQLQE